MKLWSIKGIHIPWNLPSQRILTKLLKPLLERTRGPRRYYGIGYRKGDEDIEGEGDEDRGHKAEEEEEDEEVLDEMLFHNTLLVQTFPKYKYII